MSIIGEIILVAIILGTSGVGLMSITAIKHASKRPANGELRQLREFDETVVHFHRVVKKIQKADMRAYHNKNTPKILA